jgi:hypothetical protein
MYVHWTSSPNLLICPLVADSVKVREEIDSPVSCKCTADIWYLSLWFSFLNTLFYTLQFNLSSNLETSEIVLSTGERLLIWKNIRWFDWLRSHKIALFLDIDTNIRVSQIVGFWLTEVLSYARYDYSWSTSLLSITNISERWDSGTRWTSFGDAQQNNYYYSKVK